MGHVDTILPGHTGTSWKDIYVMDTGWAVWTNSSGQTGNARSRNQRITNSFGSDKRTGVEGSFGIYYYETSYFFSFMDLGLHRTFICNQWSYHF